MLLALIYYLVELGCKDDTEVLDLFLSSQQGLALPQGFVPFIAQMQMGHWSQHRSVLSDPKT